MNKKMTLANKIMDEANNFTSWGFSVVPKGADYLVGTSLSRNAGEILNIVFEVRESEVVINTILHEVQFDEEIVKQELETLEFPVEAMGTSGEILMAKCRVPYIYAKMDTNIVVRDMMAPMVVAMTKIVVNRMA